MNFLEQITEVKKEEVSKLKKLFTLSSFETMECFEKDTISFIQQLQHNNFLSIIAEIKKASPSIGLIRENFDHLSLAETYLKNGADAISVLTDEHFFKGSNNYLQEISKIATVPILRKDFIIDEFQVYESKAIGTDIILLISEMLSKNQINELTQVANELGMEVLLEFHSVYQLSKIDLTINKLIGINNRDLKTFETNLSSTLSITDKLPPEIFIVSESGIKKKEDIRELKSANVNAILVGELLMNADNTGNALTELKKWCSNES